MRLSIALVAAFLVECGGPPSVEDVRSLSAPLAQCPAAWVEGVDVSDAQGAVDWTAARGAGVVFAFVKATQGTYDTQASFASKWAGAKAAGVVRGAYHFFDPTEDGAAQAAHFLAVAGPPAAGDLPPVLDVECPDGSPDCLYPGASGQAAPADIRSRVDAFLDAVSAGTGRRPLLYTFPGYFAGAGVDAAGLEVYPLFVADVGPGGQARAGGCVDVPAPWTVAAFWQYSWQGAVAGVGGSVDRDRLLGGAAALAAWQLPGRMDGGPGCP